jgi:hypothetical protein
VVSVRGGIEADEEHKSMDLKINIFSWEHQHSQIFHRHHAFLCLNIVIRCNKNVIKLTDVTTANCEHSRQQLTHTKTTLGEYFDFTLKRDY